MSGFAPSICISKPFYPGGKVNASIRQHETTFHGNVCMDADAVVMSARVVHLHLSANPLRTTNNVDRADF